MKSLFVLAALFSLTLAVSAQNGGTPFGKGAWINVSPSTVTHIHGIPDTLINADTVTHQFVCSGGAGFITIEPKLTKISGTVAGKVVVMGSTDGGLTFDHLDSLTFTDVALQYKFTKLTGAAYSIYQVLYISSGTVAVLPKTWYLIRKYTPN